MRRDEFRYAVASKALRELRPRVLAYVCGRPDHLRDNEGEMQIPIPELFKKFDIR